MDIRRISGDPVPRFNLTTRLADKILTCSDAEDTKYRPCTDMDKKFTPRAVSWWDSLRVKSFMQSNETFKYMHVCRASCCLSYDFYAGMLLVNMRFRSSWCTRCISVVEGGGVWPLESITQEEDWQPWSPKIELVRSNFGGCGNELGDGESPSTTKVIGGSSIGTSLGLR